MAEEQTSKIVVEYDLRDLPTAQHKAGLAGLLLQIDSMNERREHGLDLPEPPEVVERSATGLTVRFTEATTRALFDDLYEAAVVEVSVKNKWSGAKLKRTDEERVDGKVEKRYVYDQVQPSGPFLRRHVGEENEDEARWHKLWRDMLWQIPRSRPTTRGPFNKRAEGASSGEGESAWKSLLDQERAAKKGKVKLVKLASAILLGAQAVNAESVAFEDRADHALLLHFWQLVVRTFVPEQVIGDGKGGAKGEFAGFVLAVPEVSRLDRFADRYSRALGRLGSERRGYRPRDAVIALPVQGPLEFMRHLADVGEAEAAEHLPAKYLAGVEFFHLIKAGNNVKSVAHGRLAPRPELLKLYRRVRERHRNPLMLAARLAGLVAGEPWFARLAKPLAEEPAHWFAHSTSPNRTPPVMIGFAYEAAATFKEIEDMIDNETADETLGDASPTDLIVYRLVRTYVNRRAAARAGQEGEKVNYDDPSFQREQAHVAQKLFLELRSRRDVEFVEHFTATASGPVMT